MFDINYLYLKFIDISRCFSTASTAITNYAFQWNNVYVTIKVSIIDNSQLYIIILNIWVNNQKFFSVIEHVSIDIL